MLGEDAGLRARSAGPVRTCWRALRKSGALLVVGTSFVAFSPTRNVYHLLSRAYCCGRLGRWPSMFWRPRCSERLNLPWLLRCARLEPHDFYYHFLVCLVLTALEGLRAWLPCCLPLMQARDYFVCQVYLFPFFLCVGKCIQRRRFQVEPADAASLLRNIFSVSARRSHYICWPLVCCRCLLRANMWRWLTAFLHLVGQLSSRQALIS